MPRETTKAMVALPLHIDLPTGIRLLVASAGRGGPASTVPAKGDRCTSGRKESVALTEPTFHFVCPAVADCPVEDPQQEMADVGVAPILIEMFDC